MDRREMMDMGYYNEAERCFKTTRKYPTVSVSQQEKPWCCKRCGSTFHHALIEREPSCPYCWHKEVMPI
jgi:DNA-directed RNA polymerase subunit RPC12/RpoP